MDPNGSLELCLDKGIGEIDRACFPSQDQGDDEEGIEGITVEVYSTGPDMMIGGGVAGTSAGVATLASVMNPETDFWTNFTMSHEMHSFSNRSALEYDECRSSINFASG